MRRYRWRGTAKEFIASCQPGTIEALVTKLNLDRTAGGGREPDSWRNSLPRIAEVLKAGGLESVQVILEFNPHQMGRSRLDVVLAGLEADGRRVYVVIELKQWMAGTFDPETELVTGTGSTYEGDGLLHPLQQARKGAQFIRSFTQGMQDQDEVRIEPVAYLHNATSASIGTLLSPGWAAEQRLFARDTKPELVSRLRGWFAPSAAHEEAAEALVTARKKQAPALLKVAGSIFTDPDQYPMTFEQHAIFASVLKAVQSALSPTADKRETVIAIQGGPGTGKTWIAMHLLGAVAKSGRQVSYATNSTSLRDALRKRARVGLKSLEQPVDGLITSARTYWDPQDWEEPLDVLIVDEAQRIEEHTVRTGHANPAALQEQLIRNNITQLFELRRSAKVLVLLIDEDQSITPTSDCTLPKVERLVARTGSNFMSFALTEQHRSGGSEAYEAWVDALLEGEPTKWSDEDHYTVQVAASPQELERETFDPDAPGADEGARLLAGFCWQWKRWPKNPQSIEDVPFDIEIGSWRKRWNLRKPIDGFPKDSAWASSEVGHQQVGSVFTAQGFEFGRCGVIIGDDFRWDPKAERWVTDVSQNDYQKLVQEAAGNPKRGDQLIRNHYRVLLTRAMAATIIYSTDGPTRERLRQFINP